MKGCEMCATQIHGARLFHAAESSRRLGRGVCTGSLAWSFSSIVKQPRSAEDKAMIFWSVMFMGSESL